MIILIVIVSISLNIYPKVKMTINSTIDPRNNTYDSILWDVQDYVLELKDHLEQYSDKCLISLSLEHEPYALDTNEEYMKRSFGITGPTGVSGYSPSGYTPPPPKTINVDESNMLLTILLRPNNNSKLIANDMDLTLFKCPEGFVYPNNNNNRYKNFNIFSYNKYKNVQITYTVLAKPTIVQSYALIKDTINISLSQFCRKERYYDDYHYDEDDHEDNRYDYKDNYVEIINSNDSDIIADKLNNGYIKLGNITEGNSSILYEEFYSYRIQMLQISLKNPSNLQLLKDHLTTVINQISTARVSVD